MLNLHPQVLHQVDLEVDDLVGQSIGGQLRGVETADVVLLLEDGDVVVAEPGQERGGGDGGGAAAEEGDLDLVTLGQRRRNLGGQDLGNLHLLEHLHGEVLEAADVDGTLNRNISLHCYLSLPPAYLLRGVQIAAPDAEVGGGADHAAGQAQGVVAQDGLGGAVVVLVGDGGDEGLDIQLCGTGLLTRSICTL